MWCSSRYRKQREGDLRKKIKKRRNLRRRRKIKRRKKKRSKWLLLRKQRKKAKLLQKCSQFSNQFLNDIQQKRYEIVYFS